ncbi:MAG TPA: acetate--CoA ligase [Pirellulales bacterium]|jgi:acetyl-CoA synthetase|nr:acetate--CoA ligase [Pirellulales bacterium]
MAQQAKAPSENLPSGQLDTVMQEARLFPPPPEFSAKARIKSLAEYEKLWNEAAADIENFWGNLASELHWFQPYTKVLEWNEPFAQWFVGGKTNASFNCLDAHLKSATRNKPALVWEGEPGEERTLTYAELHQEVCKFANALKKLGLQAGDVASIYMPMTPELAIAMLACARLGVVHSVIFGGFSSEAIADRNNDAQAKLIITADAGWRRGQQLPLKANVDAALTKCPTVKHCIVLRRVGNPITMQPGRDHWWHDLVSVASADCPATPLDSEAPLFILYTSGSTGKPKGIKHTTAGYNLFVKKTFEWVFDHRDNDVFWCTADCGWVTGHSYVVYGPLSAGATVFMYEGAPNWPDEGRFWRLIEKYSITVFYTAPTAIRAFIKWGDHWVDKCDLSSLRLLGTVGEGINPEAWIWYHNKIGRQRCPIVDTWWQTETGGIMMSPLPGAIPTKPGSCTKPLPGIIPDIVDHTGKSVPPGQGGWLVMTKPWPGMLRGIWGDDARYKEQYWSKVPYMYLAGDNARCDKDGYYWIMGRIDDVLNVAGHRLSTIEIESALVSHPAVAEAAAVGRPHELKGDAVAVFVVLKTGEASENLRNELKQHVRKEIGSLAVPDDVRFTATLPKTRSGKIMRRLLRDIAAGKETVGDTTTLEDYSVLAKLRGNEE